MSISAVTVDRTTLPAELLPLAKSHLRVDGTYDDAFITSVIARAIARFEQVNEVAVNPTTVTWTVASTSFIDGAVTLPVRPATAAVVSQGDPPVDVSTAYNIALKWDSIHGCPIQVLQGAAAASSVALVCGFASADDLPPAVLDVVLRHTAHLYEHREILIPGREYVAPDLQLDATWWMPRA